MLDRGRVARRGPPRAVLTRRLLTGVFGTAVTVIAHPVTKRPQVLT
jgi:ABC-type hemin transport system ATPase subunit